MYCSTWSPQTGGKPQAEKKVHKGTLKPEPPLWLVFACYWKARHNCEVFKLVGKLVVWWSRSPPWLRVAPLPRQPDSGPATASCISISQHFISVNSKELAKHSLEYRRPFQNKTVNIACSPASPQIFTRETRMHL